MFCKNPIIKTAASNFLVVINMIIGFITLFVGCINNMYGRRSIKLAPGVQRGEWAPNQNHFNTVSKTLHFYTG